MTERETRLTALMTEAGPTYAAVLRRDPCAYCGGPGGVRDHIVAKAKGGGDEWENWTGACGRCNSSKGTSNALLFFGGLIRLCQSGYFGPRTDGRMFRNQRKRLPSIYVSDPGRLW